MGVPRNVFHEMGYYQSNDRNIIDYQYSFIEKLDEFVRSPVPNLEDEYIACLGAAQTLGRFVENPYPKLLADRIEIDCLNIARGGVGPEYYLQRPKLIDVANKSKFIVLQVMSGRSVSNSLFKDRGGLNHFNSPYFSGRNFSGRIWQEAYDTMSLPEFTELFLEQRAIWLDKMLSLIKSLKRPILLLYFSHQLPPKELDLSDFGNLWQSPHFIDRGMIDVLLPHVGQYYEFASRAGMPQRLTNLQGASQRVKMGMLGEDSNLNKYYPSAEMHQALASELSKFFSRNGFPESLIADHSIKRAFKPLLKKWVYPNIEEFVKSLSKSTLLIWDVSSEESWLNDVDLRCLVAGVNTWSYVIRRNHFHVDRVVVASVVNEARIKFEVKEFAMLHGKSFNVQGVYADIIFDWSIRKKKFLRNLQSDKLPKKSYVIFSAPRSGSTFLCDLLERTGKAGYPKEYFTRPVFESVLASGFEFRYWYDTVQKNTQSKNRVFGAKFIGERLGWLKTILNDVQIREIFYGHKAIILERRELDRQAVSKWCAGLSNQWHLERGGVKAIGFSYLDSYNYNAIFQVYQKLSGEKKIIEDFVSEFFTDDEVIRVDYERLVENPHSEVGRISEFLGENLSSFTVTRSSKYEKDVSPEKGRVLKRFRSDLGTES